MAVVKYGNNLAFHIGETPETVIRLKKNFGKDNVYERSWYTKEYDVNGKKVPVVMAASYSVSGNPSDRNRADRSLALKQARVNYGMHAKHDTKYFKTKKDRKKEKLNRVCGQRNSGHRFQKKTLWRNILTELVHEVIDAANAKKTIKERIEFLSDPKISKRDIIRRLVFMSYNKSIDILLPPTDPPYKPSEQPKGMSTPFDSESRRLSIFVKGLGYDDMNQSKRENIFIQILESIDPDDSKIFLAATQKKFRIKGLTVPQLNKIFDLNMSVSEKKASTNVKEQAEESVPTPA